MRACGRKPGGIAMSMEITAAVLESCDNVLRPYERSQHLQAKTLTLDDPGPGELLMRIDAAGLCHSDLSVVNGDRPRPMPVALGHEATGLVVAFGAGCNDFAMGDRVVLAFLPACGECVRCRTGEGYMCSAAAAANSEGRLPS
jgi:Zn-dependent alcohol dehydrogenase